MLASETKNKIIATALLAASLALGPSALAATERAFACSPARGREVPDEPITPSAGRLTEPAPLAGLQAAPAREAAGAVH